MTEQLNWNKEACDALNISFKTNDDGIEELDSDKMLADGWSKEDLLMLSTYLCLMSTPILDENSIDDAQDGHGIRTKEGLKWYFEGKWVPYVGFEKYEGVLKV